MTQTAKNENPIRLWGGRFTGEMDPLMNQYNESLSLDRVFYAQDIKGSIAYARANVKTGILTQEEFEKLEEGLKKVLKEWDEGKFQPAPGDEGEQAPVHIHLYFRLVGTYPDATQVASRYIKPVGGDTKWALMLLNFPFQRSTAKCTLIHSYCERAPPRRSYRNKRSGKATYRPQPQRPNSDRHAHVAP